MENQSIEEAASTSKSFISSYHRRGSPCCLGLFQTRHVLLLMGFIGFANVYAMRVNLSVAIVAMVNTSTIPYNSSIDDTCPIVPGTNSSSPREDGNFLWDETTQGLILGSFFWGYILTNPIGGWLADIIGGKRVFVFGVFCTSFLTLLCPTASYISPYLLTTLRIFIGLGEGVTFPAMNSMISKWIPPLERSHGVSIVFSGAQVGIIIAYPLCGLLCHSTFLGGWPSTFYVFGTLGLIWCIAWMALVFDSPLTHPRICDEEKKFITSSLGGHIIPQRLPIPFKEIAMSLPVWATLVAHVSQNWGYYFLLTELPTYLKNMLHFDIKESGFFSAFPYLVMWCVSIATGFLADYLRRQNLLSTVNTRRIFNSIAFYGPMVCLVSVGYSGCDTKLTLALLTVGVGLNGSLFSGAMNSHLDIASNYAGTLLGITNCAATVPGFLAPIVVGRLISGHETLSQWRLAFWIAGVVYFVGNIFYVVFVSGEEQPWNRMYTRDYHCDDEETPEDQRLLNPNENGSSSPS